MPENNVRENNRTNIKLNGSLKTVLWDLDNTLYRVNEAIYNAFDTGIAHAVRAAGVDLELDEAVKISRRSFLETGYSGHVFIEQYGLDRDKLHFDAHSFINEKLIEACSETRQLFEEVTLDHVLVTHGSGLWAQKVLAHLGLDHHFPAGRMLALEDYDFQRKSESRRAFEIALERSGRQAEETLFVEDTLDNLRIPHEMGMGTALIHHGAPPEQLPPFVHISAESARSVLKSIKASL